MPSEKFKKLLRDTSKLKEAKKICENAGYKVRSNSINESMSRLTTINYIKSTVLYLSSDNDAVCRRALCAIIKACAEELKYFEETFAYPENAHKLARDVSDKIDDIKSAADDLDDVFAGL